MSSVVVTGTGLLTAAGVGHEALQRALASGRSFVATQPSGPAASHVARELIFWPDAPEWRAVREYAGLGSQLAVAVGHQALSRALVGAAAFEPERGATIAVAGDDWTEQAAFDRAIGSARSSAQEAQQLFGELEDQFLLRTFRWGIGFGIGSVTGFQGPSVGVDAPTFAGLSGLRHALDLLESNEVDAVMLVGVDTAPRLDVVATLERLAREAGQPLPAFGQGAAALLLERSAAAAARGAKPLARVRDCVLAWHGEASSQPAPAEARSFESRAALGSLLNAGALVDACLAIAHVEAEASAGRLVLASVTGDEHMVGHGTGLLTLSHGEAHGT